MGKIKKIFRFITDPVWAVSVLIRKNPYWIKNDETYLRWDFYHGLGKWPNTPPRRLMRN